MGRLMEAKLYGMPRARQILYLLTGLPVKCPMSLSSSTYLKGFALLEVLLALALAVAVLGTALPALATTMSRLQDFHTTLTALALAKAKLIEFKHIAGATESVVQGQEGIFFWIINITDLSHLPISPETRKNFLLQEIAVRVALESQGQPIVELKTHRIERRQ